MSEPVPAPAFPDFLPTVPELLRTGAASFGAAECVISPTARIAYDGLEERSRRLAARLVIEGVRKSSRVAILFPNSVEWVVAWAAAARIGAVVIPVNTFYQAGELREFLRHADVQFLLGVSSLGRHDYLPRLEDAAPELLDQKGPDLILPSLPQMRRILMWDDASRPWALGPVGPELEAFEPPTAIERVVEGLEKDVTPSDPLVVIYTSGSTAEPKGVVHSHGALLRHANNLGAFMGYDRSARVWTSMPMFWVGGLVTALLRQLMAGGCLVVQEIFEPSVALDLLERERATVALGVADGIRRIADSPEFSKHDLSTIRRGQLWQAIPPDARPADRGLLVDSLGMTETCGPHTGPTAHDEIAGSPEARRGTFGRPVPGVQHRIVDPRTEQDQPEGTEGEILVRGYSLMLGMYKRERADVLDEDGWYHTGDRGYFRGDWLFFTGRLGDMIKTRGSNVAPAEVERHLAELPQLKMAFVVGPSHPQVGQAVVALVLPWAGAEDAVDPAQVLEHLTTRLSSYKVPRHIFVIREEDVPWLPSQKVNRRALTSLAQQLLSTVDDGSSEG